MQGKPPQIRPPAAAARNLVRKATTAALATLDADTGAPYASLVSVATSMEGAPLMLMSKLARHCQNLEADTRVSLLFDGAPAHGDPLVGPRASLMGTAAVTEAEADMRRFRARHPAAFYASFADFACFRLFPERAHLIAAFGRVQWVDGADLLLPIDQTGALEAAEADILAHMNRDHADAVTLYATMLAGAEPAPWEMVGIDPEGIDLSAGDHRLRLPFPAPVTDATAARQALVALAREARARGDT